MYMTLVHCELFRSLQIPLLVSEISDENHPVVVGLADSFYIDTDFVGSGGPG